MTAGPLPARPPLTAPPAELRRSARQPRLGLAGLLLVLPSAAVLAVGAGGAQRSVLVLAPLVTFGLPAIAMIAFWWQDWPGSVLRPGWSGLADTALVIAGAVALAAAGQAVVTGRASLPGLFSGAAWPVTLPLAGAAFVAMLQLTLVCEGWPLRSLGRYRGGLAALAASWAAAVCLSLLVRGGVVSGAALGAELVVTGAWQAWLFVLWRGWPIAGIPGRAARLAAANAAVLGGGFLSYLALRDLASLPPDIITAAAGAFIGAVLVTGMLFEGALRGRQAALAATLLAAGALYGGLAWYASGLRWDRVTSADWIAHTGLNAVGTAVILHVAIGRRWPWGALEPP